MNRWLYLLLLAVPAAILTEALHASPLVPFVLASLGLIPLAGLIALSTESLAERLGHRIGGLLNATFGNAAEIIIGLTALAAGLPREGKRETASPCSPSFRCAPSCRWGSPPRRRCAPALRPGRAPDPAARPAARASRAPRAPSRARGECGKNLSVRGIELPGMPVYP